PDPFCRELPSGDELADAVRSDAEKLSRCASTNEVTPSRFALTHLETVSVRPDCDSAAAEQRFWRPERESMNWSHDRSSQRSDRGATVQGASLGASRSWAWRAGSRGRGPVLHFGAIRRPR